MSSLDAADLPRSGLRGVLDFAFQLRAELRLILAYACGVGLLTLATPVAVQVLINAVAVGSLLQPLLAIIVLLAAALTLAAVFELLQVWLVELLGRRLFLQVAERSALAITQSTAARGRRLAQHVNRFMDVVVLEKSTAELLLDGSAVTLQVTLGLALLGAYHPILLAFAVGIVAFLLLIVIPLGRGATATALTESGEKYAMLSALQQLSEGDALHGSGKLDGLPAAVLLERSHAWLNARSQHFATVLRQKVGLWILQVNASVALLGIGGWLVREQQLTLGQLVAAEIVMTLTVSSLAKVGKLLPKLYDLSASLEKLNSVMTMPSARRGGAALESKPVTLYLPSCGLLKPQAGRHHHLMASSTLSQDFAQFVTPQPRVEDPVLINDAPIAEYDVDSLRQQVLLLRDRQLFAGTVWQNISSLAGAVTTPCVQSTKPELDRARAAAALSKVRLPPTDLDRWISSDELSPEERACLLVAAAVATQPQVLLVDRLLDGLLPETGDLLRSVVLADDAPWSALVATVSVLTPTSPATSAQSDGHGVPAPAEPAEAPHVLFQSSNPGSGRP